MLNVVVILCSLFVGARFVWAGMHAREIDACEDRLSQAAKARDRGATGLPDHALASVAFAIAGASALHLFSPVIAYALLCLAITSRLVVSLVFEERERARGRRAALLQRTAPVDPILLVWMALAAGSTLVLAPALLAASTRVSALVVVVCCIAMILVAWRIATAPRLLAGDDVEAELQLDRTRRIRRTGLVAMVSVGCVSFYAAIGEGSIQLWAAAFGIWIALGLWMIAYLRTASQAMATS
jgi:hypothetical protein